MFLRVSSMGLAVLAPLLFKCVLATLSASVPAAFIVTPPAPPMMNEMVLVPLAYVLSVTPDDHCELPVNV